MVARHIEQHTHAGRDAITSFVRIDRIGAIAGLATIAVAAPFIGEALLLAPAIALLVLIAALTVALHKLRSGQPVIGALGYATAANWLAAIAATIAIPQLWPVMNITVLIPVVLATPHLTDRQLIRLVGATLAAVVAVTLLGLMNDDGGALPDLEDELELALILGALIAHVIPSTLIVWHNNRIQRQALQQLVNLNWELERSSADLAHSRRRVVEAADEARRRIERDLHDGAQQHLVSLGVRLRLLQDLLGTEHELGSTIDGLVEGADDAVEELRRLAHGIYPPLLESQGVGAAIAATARQSGLSATIDFDDPPERPDPQVERSLYFVALEALTNVGKYAPDADVSISLAANNGSLDLVIADDGPGFDPSSLGHMNGTSNMSDRLAAVGGVVTIESAVGDGTIVRASAPRHARTTRLAGRG